MQRPVSLEWSLMIHVQHCLYHNYAKSLIQTSYWSKTGHCEKSEVLDYQSIRFCNLEGFTKDAVAASNMPQNIIFTRCSSKEIQSQTSNLQAAHEIESQIYVSTHNSREWFSRIWLFQISQAGKQEEDKMRSLKIWQYLKMYHLRSAGVLSTKGSIHFDKAALPQQQSSSN